MAWLFLLPPPHKATEDKPSIFPIHKLLFFYGGYYTIDNLDVKEKIYKLEKKWKILKQKIEASSRQLEVEFACFIVVDKGGIAE